MKFTTQRNGREFEIPDDWWSFAEMNVFHPRGTFYPYHPKCCGSIEIVPLRDIEPPTRDPGIAEFKKYKLVSVLLAFHSPECALPPIQVERLAAPNNYKYRVHNGYHRFYASVAAGYSELPIVVIERDAF